MKKISLFVFVALFMLRAAAQQNTTVEQYIATYKEIAIMEELRSGVPASITLAQGILESQAGTSKLSRSSNNHFGIKCKNDWTGATVHHDDDARGECFRSYPSVEDSYKDHSDFLRSRPHYAFLFNLDPLDFEGWAHGLKKAGYATNPKYAHILIKTINENNLQQYTLIALQRSGNQQHDYAAASQQTNTVVAVTNNTETTMMVQPAVEKSIAIAPASDEVVYPEGTFSINGTKVVFATAGTSLFAVASKANISFSKLLEYNDLDNVDILAQDRVIYLQRKPKKSADKEFHIVETAETLEAISMKEGVDLESLYEYNKIQKGMQPAAGEKVFLRPGKLPYYPKLIKSSAAR